MTPIYIIIVLVVGYNLYLQYQLYKKDVYITSINEAIKEIKSFYNHEASAEILSNLQNKFPKKSRIDYDNFKEFIFENEKNQQLFLHYTSDEITAKNILEEGFQFENTLYKTTENVTNDNIELSYKHSMRKYYGSYVIVIGISKELMKHYENEIQKHSPSAFVEQIMTLKPSYLNEDNKTIYTLPQQYVKGYFNYETGAIVKNANYNPLFDSPEFSKNWITE